MFSTGKKTLLAALAANMVLTSLAQGSDQLHYPIANTNPLQVGGEEYLEKYVSLTGLEGVRIETQFVFSAAKKYKLDRMPTDLVPQIRKRLNAVGLRMLSEEELKVTPGQPVLSIFPSYRGGGAEPIYFKRLLSDSDNTDFIVDETTEAASTETESEQQPEELAEEPRYVDVEAPPEYCKTSIWVSFQQSATILRAPDTQFKFSTWGEGDETYFCDNRGMWTYNSVLRVIDNFAKDYAKAKNLEEPKLVASVHDIPESCAQTWLMNLSVFDTNKTEITEAVKPILDQLATTAERCENYHYTIETHADKRADESYNKILSEARALAIKDYLLKNNVAYNRLTTVAYGESKPLSNGTSEADHAVNRRVVIIPKRIRS